MVGLSELQLFCLENENCNSAYIHRVVGRIKGNNAYKVLRTQSVLGPQCVLVVVINIVVAVVV